MTTIFYLTVTASLITVCWFVLNHPAMLDEKYVSELAHVGLTNPLILRRSNGHEHVTQVGEATFNNVRVKFRINNALFPGKLVRIEISYDGTNWEQLDRK